MSNKRRKNTPAAVQHAGYTRKELQAIYGKRHSKQRTAELLARYEALVRRDGPQCDLCGTGRPYEFDHVIPKPQGGTNDLSNFCLAHEYCNKAKGSEDHEAARRRLTQQRNEAEAAGDPWPPPAWQYRNHKQRTRSR